MADQRAGLHHAGDLPHAVGDDRSPRFHFAILAVVGAFVVFPILQAISRPGTAGHRAVVIGCALIFVTAYCTLIASQTRRSDLPAGGWLSLQLVALSVMLLAATVLTLWDEAAWGYLFTYCAASATLLVSDRLAYGGILLAVLLSAAVPALAGANAGSALGIAAGAAGVAVIMVLLRDLRRHNVALSAARSDLARLAVAEERERFARDLHDLLGHSLSVIALKAELAGRLAQSDAKRAAQEVADIEKVARVALGEVRDAVSGYRQPTLDGELEGARIALIAAGVDCEIDWDGAEIEPDAEAVLAWAVREGATNVIRHSIAQRCLVRVSSCTEKAAVEVVDDGVPVDAIKVSDGHGLAGLSERVSALRGQMAAGPQAGGGYRLSVTLPRP